MKFKLLGESAIRKKHGDSVRGDILLPTEKTLWLPSRVLPLNWQLGGGLQYGKIAELFGYESTGKSLLGLDFGFVAQSLGGVLLWADAESSFNPEWAKKNGLDPSRIEIYDNNDIEGMSDWVMDWCILWRSKLTNNEPIIFVLDSIATLDCAVNINSSQRDAKAEMGNRAKAIYKMLRTRNHLFKKLGICVLLINQVRKKVGASMFEASFTQPGGDAVKFYASQRIGLIASKQIKGIINKNGFKDDPKGKKMGRNIIIQIEKNKLAPPTNSVKTQVYFQPDIWNHLGYSRYHGLLDILIEEGVIKKKGNWYYYKHHSICQGEDAFIEVMHSEEKKRKILLKNSSINTISKTREKLKSLDENFYVVKGKQSIEEDDKLE